MTDFFLDLTPDRVLVAIEAAGYALTGHCTPLTCLENRVYDLRLEDGRHIVAKFYRPGRWTREAVLDEHRFLADLREAEIPVCAPLPFADGETLREVEGIQFAIWPRTGGRSPDELSDGQIQILGRLLARIHNVGAAREAPHRARLDAPTSALAPLELLERRSFLPPEVARRYRSCVEQVAEIYTERSRGIPVHRIHGDCHMGNILHGDAGWFFLDFDDMVVGPAVHDVWMLLPGRDAEGLRQRSLLIDAYRQFRDFDSAWLRLVEPLRAFRFIFYAAWIAKRWEDSAFPAAFPHFGTADYWENETRDLEEHVERIASGRDEVEPGGGRRREDAESDVELSNEDFFWDL
ncbi:MAG: serine/threonine protein kinase [Deltaproteobacteria bacterium]|nr:serine/threonine protein kinase [Deltaproteobacteria bacterium]